MPGAGLAMVEPQLLLGALETLLDCPAQAGRTGQLGKIGGRRRKDQVVGAVLLIPPAAADQQPALEALVDCPG